MLRRTTLVSLALAAAFLGAIPGNLVSIQRSASAEEPPFVYRAFLDAAQLISGADSPAGTPGLPSSLVIAPGRYAFHGKAYDVQRQGLYRFIRPNKENQQRIVYDAQGGDVDALLSGLAWCATHGNSDDSKPMETLTQKATTQKLFITCGQMSTWSLHILNRYNIRARFILTLTLDPWNNYDNGHSMIEVYREEFKKWVLYDLEGNVCFLHKNSPLSTVEMIERASSGDYEIKSLAADTKLDVSNFKSPDGYDWAFIAEFNRTDVGLRRWYKRVLQVPLIGNCFYLPSPNDADRARVENYAGAKYTCLTKEEFRKRFY